MMDDGLVQACLGMIVGRATLQSKDLGCHVSTHWQRCVHFCLLQAVVQQLQQLFPDVQPYIHPAVSSAIIVPSMGPQQPDYQQCGVYMQFAG
jgi:hypothetical protein